MSRFADIEGIEDLIEEFELSPSQRISTLLSALREEDEDDEES